MSDIFYPSIVPQYVDDWIIPDLRTKEQMKLTEEFHERIGEWGDLGFVIRDMPARFIDEEIEKLVHGELLPRPYQVTGSCVGCGWFRAFCNAMIGDIAIRGDIEEVKLPFWPATYGVGRQMGGMNGKGEGSFGGAQAESGNEFGTLPIDYPDLPQPNFNNGWMNYTKQQELQWSHPSAWPIKKDKLQDVAKGYGIGQYKRLKSAQDVKEAKSQGYGVTLASNFGTRGCRVEGDVLLAEWNGSWAHQMSCGGYWEHPTLGLLCKIDNQWKDVHGKCPTLGPLGVTGSFWIKASTMDRICETGEVYSHTATGGFKLTQVDWKNLGITYT